VRQEDGVPSEDEAWTGKVYLVGIYPVRDFARWKAELDGAERGLARLGVTRHWILRGVDDSGEVMSVLELPSREAAERLLKSTEVDVPGWLERVGLEIYPSLFLGGLLDAHDYPEPARRAPRPPD
jgi:hypothetical protein